MFLTDNEPFGNEIFKIQKMVIFSKLKNTFLLWFLMISACGNADKSQKAIADETELKYASSQTPPVVVGANRTEQYLPLLQEKKVAVVANQTSVLFKGTEDETTETFVHLVDSLLALGIQIQKVFAPEHGFRGQADAGEKVKDGVDTKTGIPLISLYGKNRKPSPEHLENLDIILFDIQDVGVRFYTYIATLQLVMEACAENDIPLIVLDRPNPNGHYVDGPTMETAHTGFLGMTEIPLVYGMSIGEYSKMINGEGWLTNGVRVDLNVVPLENYTHQTAYSLPIRPSPNLPNDTAINLYPSLGLFEGTNINAGRGTEFQFQRYGASFLDNSQYSFKYWPRPNFGSKNPKENGKVCYGKDLSQQPRMSEVSLQWLLDAYMNADNKDKVFNTNGFTKHAGTETLQQQIEAGRTEDEIKAGWQPHLEKFQKIRKKYLIY